MLLKVFNFCIVTLLIRKSYTQDVCPRPQTGLQSSLQMITYTATSESSGYPPIRQVTKLGESCEFMNDEILGCNLIVKILTAIFSNNTESYLEGYNIPGQVRLNNIMFYRSGSAFLDQSLDTIDDEGTHITVQYIYYNGVNYCAAMRIGIHDVEGPSNNPFYAFSKDVQVITQRGQSTVVLSDDLSLWNTYQPEFANITKNYAYDGNITVLTHYSDSSYIRQSVNCTIFAIPAYTLAPYISTEQDEGAFSCVEGPDGKKPYTNAYPAIFDNNVKINNVMGFQSNYITSDGYVY